MDSFSYNDDFLHPLWLGIFILIFVIVFMGTICYVRVKCGSQICQLFRREIETNPDHDVKLSPKNYTFNWPNPSPKLYTLVRNLRRANLQKQAALQHSEENEPDIHPQISISIESNLVRNPEIARKFYASMRHPSQQPNSSSVESHNEQSATSDTPSSSIDRPIQLDRKVHIRLFRTPRFFKSIPNQSST